MTFQRARSKEKKQARIDDIVRVAGEIFDKEGFDNMSLSAIAEQAGITRPAIYRYFPNKESILLKVMLLACADWSKSLVTSFLPEQSYEIAEIAHIWVRSIIDHHRMVKIYLIFNAILEKNLSLDDFVAYEKSSMQSMVPVGNLLRRLFPHATKEQVKNFLDAQLALAFGSYLTSHLSQLHREAAALANTNHVYPTFESSYMYSICILLNSLEQNTQQNGA